MKKLLLILLGLAIAVPAVYAEDAHDLSTITVTVDGNASLIMVDEQEHLTGVDPTIPKMYQDIPESNGGDVPFSRSVSIFHPQGITYHVIVLGMNFGAYKLDMAAYSQDGTPQPKITLQGDTAPGVKANYDITFNRDWSGANDASTMVQHP